MASLEVIQGGKNLDIAADPAPGKPAETVGTKTWAEKLRKRAKELSKTIETGYSELGNILRVLSDATVNNDPHDKLFIREWGFDTFPEWVEKDLGIHRRKAQRMVRVFFTIEKHLADMDPALKARLVVLPFSKVRELVRVLTLNNIAQWIPYAETHAQWEIVLAVQKYAHDKAAKEAQEQLAKNLASEAGVMKGVPGSTDLDDEHDPELDGPKELEKSFPLAFRAFAGQYESITQALEFAASLSGSSKKTHNLEMICLDFLSTNAMPKGLDGKLAYVAKVEKLLGVKLVAVDPVTGELLYGLAGLELLAQQQQQTG
jgi:hypothetical protein